MTGGSAVPRSRVVVADDDEAVRAVVCDALARHGHDVQQAEDGLALVEALESPGVELVITDIHMPGLSGFEALDAARECSPQTNFIIITGHASVQAAQNATRRGAYDFLAKPFSERELMDAVEQALARRAAERTLARERELQDLFHFTEQAGTVDDPWEMLRLSATAAMAQTGSEAACVASLREDEVWPLFVGARPSGRAVFDALDPEDIIALAARDGAPLLLSPHPSQPLADLIEVRSAAPCALEPTGDTLVVPLKVGRQTAGALAVARPEGAEPFTRGDLQLVVVIASGAGLLLKNTELLEDLARAYVGTVHSMARMVEARDPYTHGHSSRVADTCRRVAERMGVSAREAEVLQCAAGLHDIGKIAVPDAILNKPGKLTDLEWKSIRAHPVVGVEMLTPAPFLAEARPLVLHHHERYDGNGYPGRTGGQHLPPLAHIIIAADAWDAMTSDRPYRPALERKQAVDEIEAGNGTQFHPEVADAIVQMMG